MDSVVKIAEYSGFCYGVRAAVESLDNLKGEGVYTYGDIIHNKNVVERFACKGVRSVEALGSLESGSTIVFRAHGVAEAVYEEAKLLGLKIVDATCPFVGKIHRLVKEASGRGRRVVVFGNAEHPEVRGIVGWCDDALVFKDIDEACAIDEEVTVVVQTTYDSEVFRGYADRLQELYPNAEIYNTICPATRQRQQSAISLAGESDFVVVVGDKKSSNTRELFRICSAITDAVTVENAFELAECRFEDKRRIGVIGGASTPDDLIAEVVQKLKKRGTQMVNENSMAELMDQMQGTISIPRPGSIVSGKIIIVTPERLFVNIGCKNDGVVPKSEISADSNLNLEEIYSVGQDIDVYVVNKDDGEGNILLSVKRVSLDKDWEVLKSFKETGEEFVVKVTEAVKNGVTAYYNDIRGFIPASQLAVRFTKNLKPFVGKELAVVVEEADRSKRKAIFSHKPIAIREHQQKEDEFWSRIEEGIIVKGGVKRITDFGIFIDIGGKDGLVHNSEISWGGRPRLQSDMVKVGDIIDVKVLDANREKDRVSLSIKKVTPEPWSDFEHRYYVDYIYRGKVVNITDFGAFVELEPGVEGLVHVSHITRRHIKHPSEVLELGQVVEVKILEYSLADKRVKLSIKAVEEEDAMNAEAETEGATEE